MLGLDKRDKRTSIIIKNIPEELTPEQFKKIILNLNLYNEFYYKIELIDII